MINFEKRLFKRGVEKKSFSIFIEAIEKQQIHPL